jgi:hypothetical protein
LEAELSPIFERADGEPTLVKLGGYFERPTNPVGSEVFRQAIRSFIESDSTIITNYWNTLRAKKKWCSWARRLSWVVLLLAFWEVCCVALFGLGEKLFALELSNQLATISFIPTAVLVLLFFLCLSMMLLQHDIIHDNKDRYHGVS